MTDTVTTGAQPPAWEQEYREHSASAIAELNSADEANSATAKERHINRALVHATLAAAAAATCAADLLGTTHASLGTFVEDGPPCLRCGGDLLDHILTADADGGDDVYRCLVSELSDVIADLETSDPPAEQGWIEVLRAVEAAYQRSLGQ